jgi:hypothetical protein
MADEIRITQHPNSDARSEHANARQGSQADNNRLEIHVRLLQLTAQKTVTIPGGFRSLEI